MNGCNSLHLSHVVGLMSESLQYLRPFLYVSTGAVLGAWLRSFLVRKFASYYLSSSCLTTIVNVIASFSLGLVISLKTNIKYDFFFFSYEFSLFSSVGFLGSFSTFSTFILDSFNLLIDGRIKDFARFSLCSLCIASFATLVGLKLGKI